MEKPPTSKEKQQLSPKPVVSPKLKRKSYFERPLRAGSCRPDGWSELRAQSFLWQQMKAATAPVAGSCSVLECQNTGESTGSKDPRGAGLQRLAQGPAGSCAGSARAPSPGLQEGQALGPQPLECPAWGRNPFGWHRRQHSQTSTTSHHFYSFTQLCYKP